MTRCQIRPRSSRQDQLPSRNRRDQGAGGAVIERTVHIPVPGERTLVGDVGMVDTAVGIVVFAHGGGSSRTSPRNRSVAASLQEHRLHTVLFDLLTPEEQAVD